MPIIEEYKKFRKEKLLIEALARWILSEIGGGFLKVETERDIFYYAISGAPRSKRTQRVTSEEKWKSSGCKFYLSFVGKGQIVDGVEWKLLFSSGSLFFFEFLSASGTAPLRYGFCVEEKQELLSIVRRSAHHYLKSGKELPIGIFSSIPARLLEGAGSVDVAVWVNGELRGSAIETKNSFFENLLRAASRCCVDSRFKPVEKYEFEDAIFEITAWSNLQIPTDLLSDKVSSINPSLSYFFIDEYGENARYLPEVFNCVKFNSLEEIQSGLQKKRNLSSRGRLFVNKVDNWIETAYELEPNKKAITLLGPVPLEPWTSSVQEIGKLAASGLLRSVSQEGYIRSTISIDNPFASAHISWPRVAFTAWALQAYGAAIENAHCRDASARIADFLLKYQSVWRGSEAPLIQAYLGQQALCCGDVVGVKFYADAIEAAIVKARPEPLVSAQIARFLFDASLYISSAQELSEKLAHSFVSLHKNKELISLAAYAELITLEREASSRSDVGSWFVKQQHEDGSFPSTTASSFSYVRGTAKIVEAMSVYPEQYADAITRGFSWIGRMQYTRDTLYHIPPAMHADLEGGFRHDMFNRDVWIDAAAHVILAAARLDKRPH